MKKNMEKQKKWKKKNENTIIRKTNDKNNKNMMKVRNTKTLKMYNEKENEYG